MFVLIEILWTLQNSLRRPPYGASEDLSSEEEEADEAELQRERLFSSAPPKYARALRNRLHKVPKNNSPPQTQVSILLKPKSKVSVK